MRADRPAGLALALLLAAACAADAPAAARDVPPRSAAAAAAAHPVTLPGPEGVALRALLVLPPEGAPAARAPVVALHGCAGLGGPDSPPRLPRRERDWAARLAALGHPVLFPDSFGSRGLAEICRAGDTAAMPETLRRADAHAAAAWAAAQHWNAGAAPGQEVFVLGWSHGGSTALAATQAPVPPGLIRAAIALYPGCRRIGQAAPVWEPAVPVLVLLGAEDDWTPARFCQELAAGPLVPPGRVTVVTYPGAAHGFDQPGEGPVRELTGLAAARGGRARVGPDPAARADAIARVPAFLAAHGAP
jgi:dienelactone hydrolase